MRWMLLEASLSDGVLNDMVWDGLPLPKLAAKNNMVLRITEDQIVGTSNGKLEYEGPYWIDPSKTPRTFDHETKNSKDKQIKTMRGVYFLDEDTLKICLTIGNHGQRPKMLGSAPRSGLLLLTFQRRKPPGAR